MKENEKMIYELYLIELILNEMGEYEINDLIPTSYCVWISERTPDTEIVDDLFFGGKIPHMDAKHDRGVMGETLHYVDKNGMPFFELRFVENAPIED